MAKYRLTVRHFLEDNEEVQSDSEIQKYMQNVVETSLAGWDRVEAALIVNRKDAYTSQASTTDKILKIKKLVGWPWHCSTDSLPTEEDENIIACLWDGKRWTMFGMYYFDLTRRYFVNDHGKLNPSPNVWWRTVADPEPLNKLQQ